MDNFATLAVAGSRKTQGIVDYCGSLPHNRSALVVTFTQNNQKELQSRLSKCVGDHPHVVVMGWYTFLLRDFARPFLPFKFPGSRVLGFNFDGRPPLKAKDKARFLDRSDGVYACELGRLAYELVTASKGALLRRLECLYKEILIDEVQDLSGYDWEIIDILLRSTIGIRMVGDIRQAVISTNPRGRMNKRYAYAEAIQWFKSRQASGSLAITEKNTTWRCTQKIAEFSDTIFNSGWAFPKTISVNTLETEHDGVFLVRVEHVEAYVSLYTPKCLRDSIKSGKSLDLEFTNFRVAKGMTWERVLIFPTDGIRKFIQSGTYLEPLAAAKFYVAVTRACQSVAIIVDDPGRSLLPFWVPPGTS